MGKDGPVGTGTRVTLVQASGGFRARSHGDTAAATVLRAGRFGVPRGWRLPLRIAEFHVMFVGVRGRLQFVTGGVEHELGPGTVLWLPRHRAHEATAPYPQESQVFVLHFALPPVEASELRTAQRWRFTGRSADDPADRCARLVAELGAATTSGDRRADAELNLLLADLARLPTEVEVPDAPGLSGRSADIARVLDHITRHPDAPLRVTDLARLAGLQRGHFSLLFSRLTGLSPSQYVTAARIARARELLEHSALPLDAVADRCGFSSASHLTRRFKEYEGLPPGAYRDSHAPARSALGLSSRR